MCDNCLPNFSRRDLLKLSTLALPAAILAACGPNAVRETLPDPINSYQFADMPAGSPPVTIDPKTIVIPPKAPPQKTGLGSINPRSSWTASPLTLKNGIPFPPKSKLDPAPRDLLVIHHSGDGKPFKPQNRNDVIRHLEIVRRAHLQRGMIDIAYHFAIDPFGEVWQLRSLAYTGQHCRPSKNGQAWNSHSIGVCLLGDFDVQPIPPAQLNRLLAFELLVREKYALPTDAVKMHGELVETDCPGKSLRTALKDARARKKL